MSRILVHERRSVAVLLAGGPAEVPAAELVDEDLRAIACAVLELRAFGELPNPDRVAAIALARGRHIAARECETLLREGGLRRAA